MAYNPNDQYRCTIIRGKTLTKMDDLLPFYAETLDEICPIDETLYRDEFEKLLSKKLAVGQKTIQNHSTENVEKLLGMIIRDKGIIRPSERTKQYLKDHDQPLFFKTLCYKFQQPTGGQAIHTIKDKLKHNISFKPYHYILSLLKIARQKKVVLKKREIGYFCLNNLEVMQGKVTEQEVLDEIIRYRNERINFKIGRPEKKNSYNWQHIKEQFDYLKFANLIRLDGDIIHLNKNEKEVIDYFIKDVSKPLHFNIYKYNIDAKADRKKMKADWNIYFGSLKSIDIDIFTTTLKALSIPDTKEKGTKNLGDEGEYFVLDYEIEQVKQFIPRLINKVNHLGTTKGLGYDIASIEAGRDSENPEFARFIEVKSTKRATKPNLSKYWDRVNFTRNEWVAAQQHRDRFYIYRVYFTSEGVYLAIIKNPYSKDKEGKLFAAPIKYRIEFNSEAIEEDLIFSNKDQI